MVMSLISTKQWFGKGTPKTTCRTGLFGEFLVLGEVLHFSACFGSISMQVASRNFYEILGCWNLDLPMITVLCQGEAFTVPRGSCDACRQPSCFSFLVLDIKSLKYQKMEEVRALQVCSETAYCSPAG